MGKRQARPDRLCRELLEKDVKPLAFKQFTNKGDVLNGGKSELGGGENVEGGGGIEEGGEMRGTC